MKSSRSLLVFLFGLVALCAQPRAADAAANKEHLQLMAEIRMLQEQNQQLQALLGSLQDTLKTVTTKLDEQSAASRKAMADQTLAVNNIGDNVRVLREKTDETNVRISTVSQELETLRQIMSSQPGSQPVSAAPGTDPAAPSTAAPPSAPPPVGVSAQRMYEASYDDYSAGRYDLAIQGFQGFIQAFPRLPNAADAQYNIGMSYFNQGNKWAEARDAFQRTISDYPQNTDRVPEAYYKLGQTFERLNQIDNAKRAYETLVQRFPAVFSATQAKQALDRLNKR
jgi:tol-pal system protein YbgF